MPYVKTTDKEIFEALTEKMTIYQLAKKLGIMWEASLARRLRRFVKEGKMNRELQGRFYVYFTFRQQKEKKQNV